MAFDGRSGLKTPCPYGVRRQGRLCLHAVPLALATDRSRVPGRREEAIASRDMIAARDTTSQALVGLEKQRGGGGGGGSPSPWERRERKSRRIDAFNQCFAALM